MGVNVSAVEAAIRARVEAQLAAVGAVADVEARRVAAREELARLDAEYAEAWAGAVKAEVPVADLRRGGYAAPPEPVRKKKRAPRGRAAGGGGPVVGAAEEAAQERVEALAR